VTAVETIGLIAGNGRFPLIFAEGAKRAGVRVVAVAHRGETEPEIERVADEVTWIRVGELGKIIRTFQRAEVRRAVMAGGIRKVRLFSGFRPDLRGAAFLARLRSFHDDALLRGVAGELEREGIAVVESTIFLGDLVTRPGTLGRTQPKRGDEAQIALGFRVAKDVGRWDVGQSVVLKDGIVLAIEGIEGTDACIRRAGELGRSGAIVVKVAKPAQDLRFDVPAVGPGTIETMIAAKARLLALEAGRTIVLDRDEFLERADGARIAVVGVEEASVGREPHG
jgi:UDP-2,3-diacylglucosamine hydrolase